MIKVLDVIEVEVKGYEYIDEVLGRYPGYVEFDHRKHDISGVKVRYEGLAWGIPDYSYRIVLEEV